MLFAPGTCPERPRSDYALAVGDVCGNAFQVCLFLIADRRTPNNWLAALGIALSAVYAIGVVAGRSAATSAWVRTPSL
jgi:hypothetical protein